jgi:2-octaprenyl-6-methoxyphenol hydroxylase
MDDRIDVLVVGGGLVGSSLAIALDGSGLAVALAEAVPPRVDLQPGYDERNLALARASLNALGRLGVLDGDTPAPALIERSTVSRRGEFGALRLDAAALGLPAFGGVLPARELGNALLHRLDRCTAVQRLAPARLLALDPGTDAVAATLDVDGSRRRVSARLVVGADGTESFVRGAFGIGATRQDYGQSALVTTVTTERPLAGQAFERFTDTGPVALLPLAGARAGLVLCVDAGDAERVAALDDAAFVDLVHQRFGYRAGRLSRPGRRKPYPLRQVLADALTAPRAVLVGNAAQTIHPVGAQGFNLGLRDALTLAGLLREAVRQDADPGTATLLARHVERRSADRQATIAFSDDLVRLMGNGSAPLGVLRSLGFMALDRLTPIKRRHALRGMGFRGDVPAEVLSP